MQIQPARSKWAAWFGKNIPEPIAWRLWSLRPQSTGKAGMEAECGAAPWVARGSNRICHFIYGEDTYFWTPLWKSGKNSCIATFHYPPLRLIERVNPGSLRSLNAAIIVGSNQRAALERFMEPSRIIQCLHPVDTDFFRPPSERIGSRSCRRLICVGSLFRDYSVLRAVHLRLRETEFPELETHVVGPNAEQMTQLNSCAGIVIHRQISDSDFLALYQSSDVGLLPLTDATANNALLEMMACGLPIVVSDVGGIRDYISSSAARLVPSGDENAAYRETAELLRSPTVCEQEGISNRIAAVRNLSLSVIADQMHENYARISRMN